MGGFFMKKKSFKGMTLVECVIALAILAIASSVVVTACAFISQMKISTNALNKRISYQSPIADTQATGSADKITTDADGNTITVSKTYTDAGGTSITNDMNIIKVSDGAHTYEAIGELYEVKSDIVYDGKTSSTNYGTGLVDTSDHNFKFFKVVTTKKMADKTKG
jgi:prepilin-type N-terminal cleavage/methylation domain-containing protein